jgi:hypothetical protein
LGRNTRLGPLASPSLSSWRLQHFLTAALGSQPCQMHNFFGLGLQQSDALLVLEACGVGARDAARRIEHFVTTLQHGRVASSGASLSLNGNIHVAGGTYPLCWCATGQACKEHEAFQVDFGHLLMIDPSPSASQDRTCVAGQTCRFDGITGMYLSNNDKYALLETCRLGVTLHRALASGMVQQHAVTAGTGAVEAVMAAATLTLSTAFTHNCMTLAGGRYRLCRCCAVSLRECVAADGFSTDIGQYNCRAVSVSAAHLRVWSALQH